MDDLGLDTDFHNQKLEFPTVSVCPLHPFDEEKVNATAFSTFETDNTETFISLLEMLPGFSYEKIVVLPNITDTTGFY